jgi:Ca2+-binding RTX toxin-like protein
MAAEALLVLDEVTGQLKSNLKQALMDGNGHSSRYTATQADNFLAHWEVVAQKPNTNTGFSGTLFMNKDTNELVLSFRSTEFIDDAARDNQATNTLEIKNTGFAWGQIADMQAWYAELQSSGRLAAGQPFSVTGYSLGGHLATAFNLLNPTAAQQTVTFNGAGVGLITQGSLQQSLADFNALRQSPELIQARLDDSTLAGHYGLIRSHLADTSWTVAQAKTYLNGAYAGVPDENGVPTGFTSQALMLWRALDDMDILAQEAARVPTLTPGGTGPDANSHPNDVPASQIAAMDLDYRMAVRLAAENSRSASLPGGLVQAYGDKATLDVPQGNTALANQYDVVSDSKPSAVAHSQWHYGTDIRIGIEDQPLYRGGIGAGALGASLDYGDIKLLVNGYATKDFGDTHSLVLLVDSLNVQNTLLQMLPEGQRSSAEATLKQALLAASNLMRVDGALLVGSDQGKAEGDVLENMLNSLAYLALGPGEFTPLKGSPDGGTWAEITGPAGYSGRDDFYALLKRIQDSTFYKNAAAGTVTLQLATAPVDLATEAHTDFGAFAALYCLSPFALSQGGTALENAIGEFWGETYTQWKDDKDELANGDPTPALTFTDEWLRDRADLLVRKNYFNVNDTSYDSTRIGAYAKTDSIGNAIATVYDNEDIVWQDRQTEMTIQRGKLTESTRYVIFGSDEDETDIIGGRRYDSLYGGDGNDIVQGLHGDDHLEGNAGNDSLDGGSGYDMLVGGAGDDTLVGGEGHDLLLGGEGDDTYYFNGSIGLDIIRDSDGVGRIVVVGSAGSASLSGGNKLAENVWISDDNKFTYALVEGNLVIRPASDSGASGFVTVKGWTAGQLGISLSDTPAPTAIPTTIFNGDFVKLKNEAQTQYVLGSDGNYQNAGPQPDALDVIKAGDAGALIRGLGGQDALFGGTGNDVIEGGDGGDALFGSLGSDTIRGGGGVDFIYGSDRGSTTFPLTVQPPPVSAPSDTWIPGFNWTAWSFTTDADGFRQWHYSEDELTVVRQTGDSGNVLEGGAGNDVIAAGTGSDIVHGDADNDNIIGEDGNDVLFGDNGDDRIFGDASYAQHGQDILHGGLGNDLLLGRGNNDAVYGGQGNDTLYGDDRTISGTPVALRGNDYLDGGAGSDVLYGNEGDDILIGGTGNDVIYGGAGKDIYLFNRGDGIDTIVDSKDGNIFRFGTGVSKDNIKLRLGSLLLGIGNGDQVHIDGFSADDALNSVAIDSFEFADGSVLTPADLLARGFDIDGTANDDSLTGTSVDDRINGFAGNDILTAGPGSDMLTGGEGSDTFVINAGAGVVTITDAGGLDLIQFGEGISRDALDGIFTARSMVMTFGGGESVMVAGNASMRFADGATVTNLYDANGIPIGSSVSTEDANRSLTNFHAGANGTGAKLGDTWTTVLGGHGSNTFNADGSSSGIAYYVDGTYSTYTYDGAGTRVDETFNSSGVETSDRWVHPDGTWGTDVFYANGSSWGVIHNADGTYSIHDDDGHGHVQTTIYDANGKPVVVNDGTRTHPNTTDTYFADGGHRVTVEYAPGESTSTLFGADGTPLNESWTKADGSHGSEMFRSDGSSDSVVYRTDGSYQTLHRDGVRQTVVKDYTSKGVLTGSAITEVDGLNSITTYLNASGIKINETWIHPDGSTGADLVGPLDFNGLSNFMARTVAQDLANYGSWQTPDDAGGNYQFNAAQYGESWWLSDVPGHIDAHGSFNIDMWSSTEQRSHYYGWFYGPGQNNSRFYFDVGYYTLALAANDSRQQVGYYHLRDFATGVQVAGSADLSGRKFFGLTQYEDVGTIQTPVTMTLAGNGGSYDIFQDNGQGNILLTGYNASSVKIGDMWFHNDGSYGVDTYNADGSSAGVSVNPGQSYVRFSIDAQGSVAFRAYPGATAIARTKTYQPPPVVAVPPPRPPAIGAPSGGSSNTYSHTYTNEDWITYVVSSPDDNDCDQERIVYDTNGAILSRTVVHTDPGYDAAVANGAGFAGWTYDDTGLPIARYIDDGQGTVETFTFDAQRRVSGRHVAVTDAGGTVTTMSYGAAGQLVGLSAWNKPAMGQTHVVSYDAAGRVCGHTEEYSDGDGNSIVSRYDAQGVLLSSTAKVVDTGGNRTTITNYDGNGVATALIITSVTPAGVVQTDNYDASGNLTGSVVATPDGAGNIETVNYDALGGVISYVTLKTHADQSTVLTTFDAQSRRVREDILRVDGAHSNTEYGADGSSVTTSVDLSGSFSTLLRDPSGGEITALYAADGTKLSDTWMRGDGSRGSDTFNADGSSTGTATYADGSTSSSVTSVNGNITTTLRGADGAVTGSTVATQTAVETRIAADDAQGFKESESWHRADGSHGVKTWDMDGSSYEKGTAADGSTYEAGDDGSGSTWLDRYDVSGTYLGGEWAQPDGTHEVFTQNANGTVVSGTLWQPDGSYEAYVRDYVEHAITLWRYTAEGVLLETFTNHTPRAYDFISRALVQVGSAIEYVISESAFLDVDQGDVLTYRVTQGDLSPLPAWLKFDAATRTLSGTPSTPDVGDLLVWITVTDTRGAFATNSFMLGIMPARVLGPAIADQTASEDESWSLVVPAFVDEEPTETLTYAATLADGTALPAWLSFNAYNRTFTGTPADGDVETLSIKVTAADSTGASGSATFALDVGNVNDAPAVALALASQSATEDHPWTFTVPASTFIDVDTDSGDTLTFGAMLADGTVLPSWLSFDASTRTFSGKPINGDVGSVDLKVTVTDAAGASAECTFMLVVANSNDVHSPAAGSNLLGSTAKDILEGGAGNDFLNGLAGADLMIGHQGDDTYTVDTARDVVTELASEGLDTINSSITYTLPTHVENLVLTGSANRNGTGNASDNTLVGNTGRNTLRGAEGDDTLSGGPGKDVLIGGTGNDTYLMTRGSGSDKIKESDATAGNTDVALFGPDITSDQLWFQHRGRDLQVTVIGTSDKFTISNWFAGNQYHVEQFKTSDGKTLLDSQVQGLVDAMAGFSPPAAGQTTLPPNYQSQLGGVIAANWQ